MRYGGAYMALVSLSVALAACDSDATGPRVKGPSDEPLRVIEASGDLAGGAGGLSGRGRRSRQRRWRRAASGGPA